VSLDAFANFAISSLVTGITAGATSLTVTTGEGTKFPAVSFNATIWNSTDFASAYLDTTAEVVRVTVIAGDVFTITRAQEGTAAAAHNTAAKTYKILAGLTALNANKLLDKTGDTMTGSLTLSSGNLSVSAGTVSASGNISATSGSVVAGRRVGIGVSGIQTTSVALTVSSPGLQLWNPGAGQTLTLPAANAVNAGEGFEIVNISAANALTVARAGADTITNGSSTGLTSTSAAASARLSLRSDGVSIWYRNS
jgi:hypothetical protein